MTDAHHHVEPDYGTGKKTLGIYTFGIFLCVVLTLIPFSVVMYSMFSKATNFAIIYTAAILQLFVQVFCFLRLNSDTEQGKINLMSFIFTIIILLVIVGGSLWIMWNLNYRMM